MVTTEGRRELEGGRIILRELVPDDVGPAYLRWMNDPEVSRFLESRFREHSLDDLRTFVASVRADPSTTLFGILLREGGRHIGNIKIGPAHPVHRHAEIGLLVGEKDCWGRGYASEAISLVTNWAFEALGLRRVTAGCYGTNEGSVRAFEKAGFAIEARRPGHFHDRGRWVDHVLMARTRDGEAAS